MRAARLFQYPLTLLKRILVDDCWTGPLCLPPTVFANVDAVAQQSLHDGRRPQPWRAPVTLVPRAQDPLLSQPLADRVSGESRYAPAKDLPHDRGFLLVHYHVLTIVAALPLRNVSISEGHRGREHNLLAEFIGLRIAYAPPDLAQLGSGARCGADTLLVTLFRRWINEAFTRRPDLFAQAHKLLEHRVLGEILGWPHESIDGRNSQPIDILGFQLLQNELHLIVGQRLIATHAVQFDHPHHRGAKTLFHLPLVGALPSEILLIGPDAPQPQ